MRESELSPIAPFVCFEADLGVKYSSNNPFRHNGLVIKLFIFEEEQTLLKAASLNAVKNQAQGVFLGSAVMNQLISNIINLIMFKRDATSRMVVQEEDTKNCNQSFYVLKLVFGLNRYNVKYFEAERILSADNSSLTRIELAWHSPSDYMAADYGVVNGPDL